MICSSANCRTISQIARCSSVRSVWVVVAAMRQNFVTFGVESRRSRLLLVVGDKPPIERKISQVAAKQQRSVTRPQLLAIGLGPKAIDYRVRIGRLHASYPGVYTVAYRP